MRMNMTISGKTKKLIDRMQQELKEELETNTVTIGYAVGQALERYFEYKEKVEMEELRKENKRLKESLNKIKSM